MAQRILYRLNIYNYISYNICMRNLEIVSFSDLTKDEQLAIINHLNFYNVFGAFKICPGDEVVSLIGAKFDLFNESNTYSHIVNKMYSDLKSLSMGDITFQYAENNNISFHYYGKIRPGYYCQISVILDRLTGGHVPEIAFELIQEERALNDHNPPSIAEYNCWYDNYSTIYSMKPSNIHNKLTSYFKRIYNADEYTESYDKILSDILKMGDKVYNKFIKAVRIIYDNARSNLENERVEIATELLDGTELKIDVDTFEIFDIKY